MSSMNTRYGCVHVHMRYIAHYTQSILHTTQNLPGAGATQRVARQGFLPFYLQLLWQVVHGPPPVVLDNTCAVSN
jgi:hypothetical protein